MTGNLVNGKTLTKNTFINISGQALPLLVALFSIPLLIRGLGTERFGLLTLSWVILGYFGNFDFGISRALTQLIASKIGQGKNGEIPELIWFSLALLLGCGILGGILLAGLSFPLVYRFLKVPILLQHETLLSLYLVSLCVPVVLLSNALQAILAAYQRFDLINAIRIPLGAVNYLGPLCLLPFSKNIFWIILFLVLVRLALLTINFFVCKYAVADMFTNIAIHLRDAKHILSFGGWTTVSNLIGSFVINLDKVFIGSIISISAVAYYSTPYELVGKLLIIPMSFMGVMFPAFSLTYFSDKERTANYFNKANKYLFWFMLPLIAALFMFSKEILLLWLGMEFSVNSYLVLKILAVGIFISSMAQVPFSLLQGIGRPDVIAKMHMLEVPFYLIALWYAIGKFGINGAAAVWTIRVVIDAAILYGFSYSYLRAENNG